MIINRVIAVSRSPIILCKECSSCFGLAIDAFTHTFAPSRVVLSPRLLSHPSKTRLFLGWRRILAGGISRLQTSYRSLAPLPGLTHTSLILSLSRFTWSPGHHSNPSRPLVLFAFSLARQISSRDALSTLQSMAWPVLYFGGPLLSQSSAILDCAKPFYL